MLKKSNNTKEENRVFRNNSASQPCRNSILRSRGFVNFGNIMNKGCSW